MPAMTHDISGIRERFEEKFTEDKSGKNSVGVEYVDAPVSKLLSFISSEVEAEREKKNEAYRERDMLVCALTKLLPAYLARHDENDKEWEKRGKLAQAVREEERSQIFKKLNKALNKYSKPLSKGGLDYIKAFEEVEKLEHELLASLTNNEK